MACSRKLVINLDLSETPKSPEEIEAEKFADKASYDMSSYFLKKAVKDYSGKGNWEKVIQNYIRLGNNFRLEGKYDLALKYLNLGLEIALTHSGYKYSELARGYHKLAFKFLREKKYSNALELYKKALAVRIAAFGRYHKEVSKSYNSIALVYRHMGDYKSADSYYYRSLLLKLRRFESIDENFFRNFKFIDRNRIKKKFYTEAKRLLGKSLKVYLETYGGSHNLSGIIYENIGIIYTLEGDFERAMDNFRKALSIRTELFGENSLEVADTFHDMGTALILKEDFGGAEKFLKDSLEIKLNIMGENHLFSGDTLFQLGKLYLKKGEYDKSLRFFQESLSSLIKGFTPESICDNPTITKELFFKKDLIRILSLKAEAFYKRYSSYKERVKYLMCSFDAYSGSIKLIELMRNRFKPDEYNTGFESVSREIYGKALKVSLELYEMTKEHRYKINALQLSENSKAALLWRMISESQAKEFSGIPEKLLEKESELRNEIVRLEMLLEREHLRGDGMSLKRKEIIESSYFETRNGYQKLIDELERRYPKYYNLKYSNWKPGIKYIRNGLGENDAIIEYFFSDNSIIIFLITREKFIVKEVSIPSGFKDTIKDFYRSIVKIEESDFLRTSPILYEKLIAPVQNEIAGKKKLVIIPDGELFLIPFETLIPQGDKLNSFSDLEYMIKDHSFSYHYSIILHNSKSESVRVKEKSFLGFAPVFNWKTGALFKPTIKKLPKLPGTAEEVRSIMELFSIKGLFAEGYFYNDASESKFKSVLKDKDFSYIHIATHSVNNIDNPFLSGLIFSGDRDVNEEEDGVLFSREIYNLKLFADLLVLSSCESGIGKMVQGEGNLALNRGFFFAGARNIVLSLWMVEDRSTTKLMVEFYKNILSGNSYYDSLRNAKLKLISNPYTAYPKYWSGFILFGK